MRCFKIPRLISPLSLLFAFVLSAIFSSCFVSSSFAAELCSYTYTTPFNGNTNVCEDHLSDIVFVSVDFGVTSDVHSIRTSYNALYLTNTEWISARYFTVSNMPYSIVQYVYDVSEQYPVTYKFYDSLPFGTTPSGNIDISENGTYDVTNYSSATVNVENQVIQGDYHDDLVTINNSILICGAIVLILYFFYCIYRIFIVTFGGRQ